MTLGDSPTKWCWMAAGSPRHEDCVDSSGQCWVCGGQSNRTMPRSKWLGATYTGQNRVKAWHSDVICEPCVFLHSRTFPVPGRPPGKCSGCDGTRAVTKVPSKGKVSRSKVGDPCPKCNGTGLAEFGGNWRNYSVLVEVVDGVPELVTASKGEKSIIREWLQRRKKGMWFAALAESGQKHVIPSAPLNAEGIIGLVQFEETTIPIGEDWSLLSAMEEALTQGVSKDAIGTGKYTVKQYQELEHAIEAFEAAHAHERGGDWFDLALFLAQKREEDGPRKKEEPKSTDGRTAAGNKSRPARSRSKPDESLGTTSDTSGASVQDSGHAGCVVFGAVPKPEHTDSKPQLGFVF